MNKKVVTAIATTITGVGCFLVSKYFDKKAEKELQELQEQLEKETEATEKIVDEAIKEHNEAVRKFKELNKELSENVKVLKEDYERKILENKVQEDIIHNQDKIIEGLKLENEQLKK